MADNNNELFKSAINEYVNWLDGERTDKAEYAQANSQVESQIGSFTGGKPVSGGSIRALIQEHLRKPFIMANYPGKNRLFSSAYAKEQYDKLINSGVDETDPVLKRYLIAEFEASSEYSIVLYDDALKINKSSDSTVYVKEGDTSSKGVYFRKYFNILQGDKLRQGQLYITFTISNLNYKTSTMKVGPFSPSDRINVNLSHLLHPGENKIDYVLSTVVNNQTIVDSSSYKINVVKFNITSNFPYYNTLTLTNLVEYCDDINVALEKSSILQGSPQLNCVIDDENQTIQDISLASGSTNPFISSTVVGHQMYDLGDGLHNAKIIARESVQSVGGATTTIYSNMLYVLFGKYGASDSSEAIHNLTFMMSIDTNVISTNSDNEENEEQNDNANNPILQTGAPTLNLVQYQEFIFKWALVSSMGANAAVSIPVTWKLQQKTINEDNWTDVEVYGPENITITTGSTNAHRLTIRPTIATTNDVTKQARLVGSIDYKWVNYAGDGEPFDIILPVSISHADYQAVETPGYVLKLDNSADYTNDNVSARRWRSSVGNYACTFNEGSQRAFPWNSISGWASKSMHVSPGDFIKIPYNVFSTPEQNVYDAHNRGFTVEIDFEIRSCIDATKPVILVGGGKVGASNNEYSKILITGNTASLYCDGVEGNAPLVSTNFRAGERIRLAFVVNPLRGTEAATNNRDANMVFIVNNGVLEKAAVYSSSNKMSSSLNAGIWIGQQNDGTNANNIVGSDVYIYGIKIWQKSLTVNELFNNYAFGASGQKTIYSENDSLAGILSRNDILTNGSINYTSTRNKLPVVLITGYLNHMVAGLDTQDYPQTSGKDLNMVVNLAKMDSSNPSKDFIIPNCRIRKHGQSTLNYPVPSFKIWSNSKFTPNDALDTTGRGTTPITERTEGFGLWPCDVDTNGIPSIKADSAAAFKGRFQVTAGAIPANKWVLQANYADSSGVHNGGIMSLINDSWYNAKIDGKYRLRTIPQLIASITDRSELAEEDFYVTNEDIQAYDAWYQQKQSNPKAKKQCMYEYNGTVGSLENRTVKLWSEAMGQDSVFPYKIRIAPDSFPVAVFWRQNEDDNIKFLGQYVFMDDKKSDYIYGERSIYKVEGDPFCQWSQNSKKDTKENRLWNNKNCLRMEIVKINNDFVSYRSHTLGQHAFNDNVTMFEMDDDKEFYLDINGNKIYADGSLTEPETDLDKVAAKGGKSLGTAPCWNDAFEMIYPDEDDVFEEWMEDNDVTSISDIQKSTLKNECIDSFNTLHLWLTGTYNSFKNYLNTNASSIRQQFSIPNNEQLNVSDFVYGGEYYDTSIANAALNDFISSAADHLDLYKLAAYYICFLRFGLVDSVERNAQPKTYDGVHWHYEPWDMDIALGNNNKGIITWTPPMTRRTNNGSVAAYSGTLYSPTSDKVASSSWLWDALESYPYWRTTIVPKVAKALASTLTYDNICKVLDEKYAAAWCEMMYNISGHFKYIETSQNKGSNLYGWLQGSRTSHRHYWLKTSMDYYDARWACGDYLNTASYINIKYNTAKDGDNEHQYPCPIIITPVSNGYFAYGVEVNGNATMKESSLTEIHGAQQGSVWFPAPPTGEYNGVPFNTTNDNAETKSPFYIYGSNNISKIDMSNVYREPNKSGAIGGMYLQWISSEFSTLNIGVPYDILKQGIINADAIVVQNGEQKFRNVKELFIQGCKNVTKTDIENGQSVTKMVPAEYNKMLDNTENLKKFCAIATDITSFTSNSYQPNNGARVYQGGHYELLQLPDIITTLEFHDSTWDVDDNTWDTDETQIEFDSNETNSASLWSANGHTLCNPEDVPGLSFWHYEKVMSGNVAVGGLLRKVPFSKLPNLRTLIIKSSNMPLCAVKLIKEFVNMAIASGTPGDYTLSFTGMYIDQDWNNANPNDGFTYQDLCNMAELNHGLNNIQTNFKGYLLLKNLYATGESGNLSYDAINAKIQHISDLFGSNVFVRNATGQNLVVDFVASTNDDIFVTMSSRQALAGKSACSIYKSQSTVEIGPSNNRETIPVLGTVYPGYAVEPTEQNPNPTYNVNTANQILINATKFLLPGTNDNQTLAYLDPLTGERTDYNMTYDYRGMHIVNPTNDIDRSLILQIPELTRDIYGNLPSMLYFYLENISTDENDNEVPIPKKFAVEVFNKLYPQEVNDLVTTTYNNQTYTCVKNTTGTGANRTINVTVPGLTANTQAFIDLNLIYQSTVDEYGENGLVTRAVTDDDKAMIRSITFEFVSGEEFNNSVFSLNTASGIHDAIVALSENVADTTKCKIRAKINYASGDVNDVLTFILTFKQDNVVLTSTSNNALHTVISALGNIPALTSVGGNNIKLFTESSFANITSLDLSTNNTYLTNKGTELGNIASFKVAPNVNDESPLYNKTIFDYLPNNITSIVLNGCTGITEATNIDATNWTVLNKFEDTCSSAAKINFTFGSDITSNFTLNIVKVYNAGAISIKNIQGLSNSGCIDIQNATNINFDNIKSFANASFNLTVDYSNLTGLTLKDVGLDFLTAKDIFDYVCDFIDDGISNSNLREIPIHLGWNFGSTSVSPLDSSSQNVLAKQDFILTYLSQFTPWGDSFTVANGSSLSVSYHYSEVKSNIQTLAPGLITEWGSELMRLTPEALNTYVKGQVSGGIITPSTLSTKQWASLIAGYTGTKSTVHDLLWVTHCAGQGLANGGHDFDKQYPNLTYLGIGGNGKMLVHKYSGMKGTIVTTRLRQIEFDDSQYSCELYYVILIITEEAVDYFYSALFPSGTATTTDDKKTELATLNIYCKISSNEGDANLNDSGIKNLTKAELKAFYQSINPSTGHKLKFNTSHIHGEHSTVNLSNFYTTELNS